MADLKVGLGWEDLVDVFKKYRRSKWEIVNSGSIGAGYRFFSGSASWLDLKEPRGWESRLEYIGAGIGWSRGFVNLSNPMTRTDEKVADAIQKGHNANSSIGMFSKGGIYYNSKHKSEDLNYDDFIGGYLTVEISGAVGYGGSIAFVLFGVGHSSPSGGLLWKAAQGFGFSTGGTAAGLLVPLVESSAGMFWLGGFNYGIVNGGSLNVGTGVMGFLNSEHRPPSVIEADRKNYQEFMKYKKERDILRRFEPWSIFPGSTYAAKVWQLRMEEHEKDIVRQWDPWREVRRPGGTEPSTRPRPGAPAPAGHNHAGHNHRQHSRHHRPGIPSVFNYLDRFFKRIHL